MPQRVNAADIDQAATMARKAADNLDELLKATPPGCLCRTIDTDNYSYLDYAEACRHHGRLYLLEKDLEARHEKLVKALKNEARMKLVAAALSGAAAFPQEDDHIGRNAHIERALTIADDTIHRLTETA